MTLDLSPFVTTFFFFVFVFVFVFVFFVFGTPVFSALASRVTAKRLTAIRALDSRKEASGRGAARTSAQRVEVRYTA